MPKRLQGSKKDIPYIKDFIETTLRTKLKHDQENLRITSEGDLQSCVYYRLRRYFKKTPNWFVLNKVYMGKKDASKKVPDITIMYLRNDGKKLYPCFLMELKETIGPLTTKSKNGYRKDIKKLKALINASPKKIKRCYLIVATLPDPNRQYSHGLQNRNITGPSTAEIEEAIQKNKYTSKIMPIVLNAMYDRRGRVDVKFQKKHRLLRKYRE